MIKSVWYFISPGKLLYQDVRAEDKTKKTKVKGEFNYERQRQKTTIGPAHHKAAVSPAMDRQGKHH